MAQDNNIKELKNRAAAYWKHEENEMNVIVDFNVNEPENYLIIQATHNGKDVTAFFDYVDSQTEGLFIEKITEAIFEEIATQATENYFKHKKTA